MPDAGLEDGPIAKSDATDEPPGLIKGVSLMRKRHPARPRLESMETRVVPSVMGVHAHAEQAVAAHVRQLHAHEERVATTRTDRRDAALRHQHPVKHTVSIEQTGSKSAKPAPTKTGGIAGFFKSIFAGL
jgi:hypothetical protein